MTSRAMCGVACASITMTPSSPTMTPEFGSRSAVNAQQFFDNLGKLIFLAFRSDREAKLFIGVYSLIGTLKDNDEV